MSCILIVDDNREMRLLIRSIVRSVTDTVVECDDGADALPAYIAHRPEWVLMDVEMTGLDGIQSHQGDRRAVSGRTVIIVTQYTDAGTREAAQAAGATGFVSKDNLSEIRARLTQQDALS